MNATNPEYTFSIASFEIILLSIGAFLLGTLLCWLLRRLGICCRLAHDDSSMAWERNSNTTSNKLRTEPVSLPNVSLPTSSSKSSKREFPRPELQDGGFTADINTLLRDNSPAVPASTTVTSSSTPTATGLGVSSIAASIANSTIASLGNGRKDNLKKLEGVGPKIEKLLNRAGIQNFDQLAAITPDLLKSLLDAEGGQFKMHDPKSWPYQAELAAKGEWERLKDYQNLIISGRDI